MTTVAEGIVGEVLSLARQSVKESHRETIAAYLQEFASALPTGVLKEQPPHELLGFLMERFAFLEEDFSAGLKIAISHPSESIGGEQLNCTAVETRLPDGAFIVRTIKDFFRKRKLQIEMVIHPVIGVHHHDGQITGIDSTGVEGDRTSVMYLHVTQIPEDSWEDVKAQLALRLETLLVVNQDYQPCMRKLAGIKARMAERPAGQDAAAVADWLGDNKFVFMAYAYFTQTGELQDCLGMLRMPEQEALRALAIDIARGRLDRPEPYAVYRTDHLSLVKSESQLRYASFRDFNEDHSVKGEHLFLGLLSTRGGAEQNKDIPVISDKMKVILDSMSLMVGSYSYKKTFAILNSIPLSDMFYSTEKEIREVTRFIQQAEAGDHTNVRVYRRAGSVRRIATICVIPRLRHSLALTDRVSETICKFLEVPHLRTYFRESDDEGPVRMHFYVSRYRDGVDDAALETLQARVATVLKTWEELLQGMLRERFPPVTSRPKSKYLALSGSSGPELWAKYGGGFSEAFRTCQTAQTGLNVIEMLQRLETEETDQVSMTYHVEEDYTELQLVSALPLSLNDVVPVLQNMTLTATGRLSEPLEAIGGPDAYFNSFEVAANDRTLLTRQDAVDRLSRIVSKVLSNRLLDDPLLGLGALAGLHWGQIDLMITYRNYFLQMFTEYGVHSVNDTLLANFDCARLAVEYFETKFGPGESEDTQARATQLLPPIEQRYEARLEKVKLIQEDVILRLFFFELFKNTIRTNFYKPGRGEIVSIKINSRSIERMARPRPLFEIYVHGPGVEGIHLRGGMVARGGIRHSDRADDFRTEVHGLVKAQMAKNSVIVPVGSKGGFYPRHAFADRARNRAEATRQYQNFIGGLLDLTDNYVDDAVVPASGVLRYDGDDPYLVVAADKGTAHLSDTANGISSKYDFWLDDAFASGGSAGYDHKLMGITARGAWVCVERHFRELGVNIEETPIRVAGIGDMSGDVFGNGMLLNDRMQLVTAFNHMHIFIDPDPTDSVAAHAERKRLFEKPRSMWTDYDSKLISAGGGIYDRGAKAIELSAEAQKMFGCGPEPMTGPELIKMILMLDVDLLWFGGIGTYIKASSENHVQVGDKVNDSVRVDANQIRAKVIGEGANLGVTARARTEFYLAGGHCNTDALDNSAGVDCSDHEVNLKILMTQLISKGLVADYEARNKLLRQMEDEVGEFCLRNNYLQSALITMESQRCLQDPQAFIELLHYLEASGGLDRASECIAPDDELRDWCASGKGIPRNMLSVIVAYTKNDLYRQVLESQIPDLPFFSPFLRSYFPTLVREQFDAQLDAHRLRREIIATVVTNALINQAGSTLLTDLAKESSAPLESLVVRYFICDDLLGGASLREATHALDNQVASADQYDALITQEDTLRGLVRWWAWNENSWQLSTEQVDGIRADFDLAAAALFDGLPEVDKQPILKRERALERRQFDKALATRIARLPLLRSAFLLLAASQEAEQPIATMAGRYYQAGHTLHLDLASRILTDQPPGNLWDQRFHRILERNVAALRRRFICRYDDTSFEKLASQQVEHIERIGQSLQAVETAGERGRVPLFLIMDDLEGLLGD